MNSTCVQNFLQHQIYKVIQVNYKSLINWQKIIWQEFSFRNVLYYPYHQWSQPDRLVLRSGKPSRSVYQHSPPPSWPLSLVFGHLLLTTLLAVQWKCSVHRHCHTHSRHVPDSEKEKKNGSSWLIINSNGVLLLTTQTIQNDVFCMTKKNFMQNFILLQHLHVNYLYIIKLDRRTGAVEFDKISLWNKHPCKAESYQDNKDSKYKLDL